MCLNAIIINKTNRCLDGAHRVRDEEEETAFFFFLRTPPLTSYFLFKSYSVYVYITEHLRESLSRLIDWQAGRVWLAIALPTLFTSTDCSDGKRDYFFFHY